MATLVTQNLHTQSSRAAQSQQAAVALQNMTAAVADFWPWWHPVRAKSYLPLHR